MPVSSEFARGVRFALENKQTFTKAEGPQITQFGDFQLGLKPNDFSSGSMAHIARVINAYLAIAAKGAN